MYVYYLYMEEVHQRLAKIRYDSKEQFYVTVQHHWEGRGYDFLFESFLKFKNQLIKIVNETKGSEYVQEMIEKTVDISVFKDIVSNYEENTNELFYKDVFETLKHVYLSLFGKKFADENKSTIENGKFFTMCNEFKKSEYKSCVESNVDEFAWYVPLKEIPLFIKNINLCLDAIYDTRKQMITVLQKRIATEEGEQNTVEEGEVKMAEEKAL
jgi:hypothetical protein